MKIIVIGAVTAGIAAATKARRTSKVAKGWETDTTIGCKNT